MYDVAIIGAGPAGSTAARSCAARGMKTLLLDSQAFPRRKACGGGVTTAALNALGLTLPSRLSLARIHRLKACYGGKSLHINHSAPFMTIVNRSDFDSFLAETSVKAGADFHQGEALREMTRDGDFTQIHTDGGTYMARAVIGADGAFSTAARLSGIGGKPLGRALCLSADVPAHLTGDSDSIQIFYGLIPRGYCWVFPKGAGLSIGSGCISGSYPLLKTGLDLLVRTVGLDAPDEVRGGWIPSANQAKDFVADGIILTGDAAGFVDPFTGEGIKYAVISGRLAADTIWDCLSKGLACNKKNLGGYSEKCRQAFLNDFKYSHLLTRAFFALPGVMHGYLFAHQETYSLLLDILTGKNSYKTLFKTAACQLPGHYLRLPYHIFSKNGQTQG